MNAHFLTRSACPVCEGRSARTLLARPYAESRLRAALENFYRDVGGLDYEALLGAEYILLLCPDCGLAYQRDVPDDLLLGRLYEEWISPEKAFARFHATVSPVREVEIAREVALSLALVPQPSAPPRVLDYGCGWGEWGRAALAAGAETWGTELSATRRAACERLGLRVVADTELPDACFDLISADQVFEHLPAPRATLALLAAKLRPGGVIRLAVPNARDIASVVPDFDREVVRPRLGRLNPVAPLEHLNGFTTAALIRLASSCGLVRRIPSWSALLSTLRWPPGARAKAKQVALLWHLRGAHPTQLWFERAPGRSP